MPINVKISNIFINSNTKTRTIHYLGSSFDITAIFNVATLTSAKITILDPTLVTKVNAANMTKQVDKVYSYIYQTVSTDLNGIYVIQITAIYNGKTIFDEKTFELVKQTND